MDSCLRKKPIAVRAKEAREERVKRQLVLFPPASLPPLLLLTALMEEFLNLKVLRDIVVR